MILGRRNLTLMITLVVLGSLGVAGAAYVYSLCSTSCERSRTAKKAETVKKAKPVAEPQLQFADGEKIALARIAPGRPVAIVVMKGEWCPVCRKQLKVLSEQASDIRATGGVVVGLNQGNPADNARLEEELDLTFPVLSASDDQLRQWGLNGSCHPTPGVVFLNPDGQIDKIHRGRYPGRPQQSWILEHLRQL